MKLQNHIKVNVKTIGMLLLLRGNIG